MARPDDGSITIILNPAAGGGRGARAEAAIRSAFTEAGLAFVLMKTAHRGHAIDLARSAGEYGARVVAVAGGDGTVNEVINGLAATAAEGESIGPLLVLPVGGANDFAANTGGPRDAAAAAAAAATPRLRTVDLGCVVLRDGAEVVRRYFCNSLGAGFEALVDVEAGRIKRLRGLARYLVATLRSLRSRRATEMAIAWEEADGGRHRVQRRCLMTTIGNGARSGGGFLLTPSAVPDDGLLDACVVGDLSRLRILCLLPRVLRGTHVTDPAVEIRRFRRMRLTTGQPVPVHADGEVLSEQAGSLEIEVHPGRLRLLT